MITEVWLVTTEDGVHENRELVTYVPDDIRIVAANLIARYYVSKIGNYRLYGLSSTPFKAALELIPHKLLPFNCITTLEDLLDYDVLDDALVEDDNVSTLQNIISSIMHSEKESDKELKKYVSDILDASKYNIRCMVNNPPTDRLNEFKDIASLETAVLARSVVAIYKK